MLLQNFNINLVVVVGIYSVAMFLGIIIYRSFKLLPIFPLRKIIATSIGMAILTFATLHFLPIKFDSNGEFAVILVIGLFADKLFETVMLRRDSIARTIIKAVMFLIVRNIPKEMTTDDLFKDNPLSDEENNSRKENEGE